jgi:hypothetical protein
MMKRRTIVGKATDKKEIAPRSRIGRAAFKLPLACAGMAMIATRAAAQPAAPLDPLAEMRAAAGGDSWSRVRSIVAVGTAEQPGMSSNWRMAADLREPRLMHFRDAGIVRELHVWNGPNHWHQRAEGGVHAYDSTFARENSATDEWLEQRDYLRPDAGGAQLSAAERRTDGDHAFIVMRATPPHGQPVELWFGAADHLLARTVRRLNLETETVRFTDYRRVQDVMLPFRMTADTGDSGSAETISVASYTLNAARPDDFAVPRATIPASLAAGRRFRSGTTATSWFRP